nr:Ig D delta [Murid betaherpesvirus 1]
CYHLLPESDGPSRRPDGPALADFLFKIYSKSYKISARTSHKAIVNTIQHSCIMDEQSDSYMDLEEENGLWPTMCTFVALFLLTLLYSGFVTFIKVK